MTIWYHANQDPMLVGLNNGILCLIDVVFWSPKLYLFTLKYFIEGWTPASQRSKILQIILIFFTSFVSYHHHNLPLNFKFNEREKTITFWFDSKVDGLESKGNVLKVSTKWTVVQTEINVFLFEYWIMQISVHFGSQVMARVHFWTDCSL